MGDPATLVESVTSPIVTAIPAVIAEEMQDANKAQSANKNGKKADCGSGSGSFFTWFIVLALLGVWTSVAVVYFDLVDYQGVVDKAKGLQINLSEALQGKLVAYDTDGDGDFDVEDAKVLLGKDDTHINVGAGLTSEGDGQGESEILDWLEEVEQGSSDWLNGFFTFLYGLINPLEPLEEDEHSASGGLVEAQEEEDDEEDEDEGRFGKRGADDDDDDDDGNRGQKIMKNLEMQPGEELRKSQAGELLVLCPAQKKTSPTRDVGLKLREALKQQLAIIHERVEAKKLAKLALAEVRQLLAKEEEDKELELGRKEISARVKERVATRLKEEEEKIEKEEMEKALEKLRKEKAKLDEKEESKEEKQGETKSKKGMEEEEKKVEGMGKKAQEEDKGRGKESAKEKKRSKPEKSDRGRK
ncbi:hypothetical protein FQN60_016456 [Etheostoma spectabile]|uniref:Aspartyl beta-hydroxylase/Triadin domain-containing protein n=1 Tax=Etheostoma spectabile TaxID=54343 RepID=A0A5J5D2K9_9PERO|nr:hypothetical protein FQN60_016456 [Etheostoma spectabile]